MVSPVNFKGSVFFTDKKMALNNANDIKYLTQCAKENDCDIFVLNVSDLNDGTSAYETMVLKRGNTPEKNEIFTNVFGFFHN